MGWAEAEKEMAMAMGWTEEETAATEKGWAAATATQRGSAGRAKGGAEATGCSAGSGAETGTREGGTLRRGRVSLSSRRSADDL